MTEEEMANAMQGNITLTEQAKMDVDRLLKKLREIFHEYLEEKSEIRFDLRLIILGRVLNASVTSHYSKVAEYYYQSAIKCVKNIVTKKGNNMEQEVEKKVSALTKKIKVSAELEKFLGVSEIARTEVTKKLWLHIKANNLQDPKDKRVIIPDAVLSPLIGADPINMMKMTSVLSKHFLVEKKAKVAKGNK
jgi:chromatin remodeling complex protein RSC6